MKERRQRKEVILLRLVRKIHRTIGIFLFVLFLVVSVTGVLLGWKKHSGGIIQAKSYSGTSLDLKDWLPLDTLHKIALEILRDSVSVGLSIDLDRIDIRPDKGLAKFVFAHHYWGVQLDGASGKLLHLERRRSDLIEHIHDGSILDRLLGTGDEQIKLLYTSVMGLALLTFSITGFWLWYGPRYLKKSKNFIPPLG